MKEKQSDIRIVWSDRSVRWFRNASEFTGYNRELAKVLLEYLPEDAALCDMGCGAGLIDFELAGHVASICCVDHSPTAIAAVENEIRRQGSCNITARCMDGRQVAERFDHIIALYHGGPECVRDYLPKVRKSLLLVTHGRKHGSFSPRGAQTEKPFGASAVLSYLDQTGIPYTLREFTLEHGQPFESLEEAKEFLMAYTDDLTGEALDAHLAETLQKTGDPRFPWYLPKKKKIALFVIPSPDSCPAAGG